MAAIEKLMQRKGAFDYILLETTGLADPGLSFLKATATLRLLGILNSYLTTNF